MFGFGKKIGMTRLFVEGKNIAVTVLEIADSHVLQKKTDKKDGYNAVQLGAYPRSKGNTRKPASGASKKYINQEVEFKFISEFDINELPEDKTVFNIEDVNPEERLKISGNSIGKGFTGAVKRHGFAGQPSSHGHDHKRAVGSIGARWPQRVIPGTRMAGRSGGKQVSIKDCKVIAIDKEQNLIFVKGSLPGANKGILKIQKMK